MDLRDWLFEKHFEETPNWLAEFDAQSPAKAKDLVQDFLQSRLCVYPGSGQDGTTVQIFNEAQACHCFLYIDYSISRAQLEVELQQHGFLDYKSVARIDVSEGDFGIGNWTPHLRAEEVNYRFTPVKPYAVLEILEKSPDAVVSGASRLAILFLAADGHAAYDAVFCQKNSGPAPFALIVQDHGFGGNWADFGAGGPMERIASRTKVFPSMILVGDNTQPWSDYGPIDGADPVLISNHRSRRLYTRLP